MRIFQNFLSLQTLDPESPTNMKHAKGKTSIFVYINYITYKSTQFDTSLKLQTPMMRRLNQLTK